MGYHPFMETLISIHIPSPADPSNCLGPELLHPRRRNFEMPRHSSTSPRGEERNAAKNAPWNLRICLCNGLSDLKSLSVNFGNNTNDMKQDEFIMLIIYLGWSIVTKLWPNFCDLSQGHYLMGTCRPVDLQKCRYLPEIHPNKLIWRFPEMVVPPSHPFIDGFSTIKYYEPSILGYLHLRKPPYGIGLQFTKSWMSPDDTFELFIIDFTASIAIVFSLSPRDSTRHFIVQRT